MTAGDCVRIRPHCDTGFHERAQSVSSDLFSAQRADWSLLEHEALYEKSLVLAGGSFSFVVEIEKDGAWKFMCMLPYHMHMGMMGQMATPGMATDMRMQTGAMAPG